LAYLFSYRSTRLEHYRDRWKRLLAGGAATQTADQEIAETGGRKSSLAASN
jgi:hypothetical protein